ncbi:MAG: RluA family pseudouridine synthase [Rickettsiales bacterium]
MQSEVTIKEADDDIRLDRWFKRHFPGFPHSMLEKSLRKGLIRLDGKKAKSSDRIHTGQVLTYPEIKNMRKPTKKRRCTEEERRAIQSWVLFKNKHVIVINKPFGLPVQGGSKVSKSVDDMLDGLMFDMTERPKLVHRLDRDTSGVLVLARTSKAASVLSRAFSGKTAEKTYWALVNNVPEKFKGLIDYKLIKAVQAESSHERVAIDDEDGKYAQTEYKVLDALARKFAFMELKPLTGRTHQLRVHMQAIGCSIVGDHKYGGSMEDATAIGVENKLHLHARHIHIPGMGGVPAVNVTAPLPEHMKKSIDALGINIPKN